MTPLDFLEHLLVRLPINKQHTDVSKIKKHAQAFISLAARGKFSMLFFRSCFCFMWGRCLYRSILYWTPRTSEKQKNLKRKETFSIEMKSSIHFGVLMHRFALPSLFFRESVWCHLFAHIIHPYLFITIFSYSVLHLIAAVKNGCQNHCKHYNHGMSFYNLIEWYEFLTLKWSFFHTHTMFCSL